MNFKEKLTQIFKNILFYLSVPKCVGCKTRLSISDGPICPECLREYENVKTMNCSLCSKQLSECSCSNAYLKKNHIHHLVKIFRYVHRDPIPSNNLIYSLKRDNRRDVLDFLTDELEKSIRASVMDPEKCIFTNVPRRQSTVRKYGIDHAAELSRSVAKRFGAEYRVLLHSKSKRAQKKLSGSERMLNANYSLKKNADSLEKKAVILVDDIVTTGASMGKCASLIYTLGPSKIIGAAISIAYKDPYKPFDQSDRFLYKKG